MKRLLALSLIVNTLLLAFLGYKWLQRFPKKLPYSYQSNYQYTEQTNIFLAYNTKCKISVIGDSHIYKCHWSELLGQVVCNRGVGSDVTQGVFSRIKEVMACNPEICFIQCGSNDIDFKIPVDTILYYYKKIVGVLKSGGIKPVIMEITTVAHDYTNKDFNRMAEGINLQLRELAPTIRITVEPKDLQPDGIHLTASGYFKWKEAINNFLQGANPVVILP